MIHNLSHSILRPWSPGDVDSLVRCANNFRVSENMRDGFPYPYKTGHAKTWIEFASGNLTDIFLAIVIDGNAVGGFGMNHKEDIYRLNAEIGYWLAEEYWNRGIMSEIITTMTSWIFQNLSVIRIFAAVFEKNLASMKVLEKSGYLLEAIHKKTVIKNDILMDEYVYANYKPKVSEE